MPSNVLVNVPVAACFFPHCWTLQYCAVLCTLTTLVLAHYRVLYYLQYTAALYYLHYIAVLYYLHYIAVL